MSNIGMMEGAFFVGRKEIMDWVNQTLDLNLAKVEDTANGAIACQILDIMYPGKVPMSKVNWSVKQSFEFVANYKILQTCFTKLNIERHIDVDRLITGKYMDNLEFMQWFKRFYEMSVADRGDYDPYAQRCKGKGGDKYGGGRKPAGGGGGVSKPAATKASSNATAAKPTAAPASKPSATASSRASSKPVMEQENSAPVVNRPAPAGGSVSSDAQKEINTLKVANQDAARAYAELRTEMEGLEKERDFYFEKLRDIEIMLQDLEDRGEGTPLSASIFKILYATAEGFEPVASTPSTAAAAAALAGGAAAVEEDLAMKTNAEVYPENQQNIESY
mmetsp:Transcript_501/g.892  ORF Transcript_501/g.892 Transcript_501/m.892 type:complete len:333 (+) Transcript_501:76-1074(+)